MESIDKNMSTLSILACADVDAESAQKIAERLVQEHPKFDLILLFGPFVHRETKSHEEVVTAEGDIASIIAQFENIVCRVCYLPSEQDPPNTLIEQLHLTPNSVNIHARRLNLTKELFLTGFSEKGNTEVGKGVSEGDRDRSAESDDEFEAQVEVKSALSVQVIAEIISGGEERSSEAPTVPNIESSGIFALNYKFSHTLNQFLFHMSDQLNENGINLAIISSVSNRNEVTRLPKKFGNLSIAALSSLREGFYTTIDMENTVSSSGGKSWKTTNIETHML
jgi:hypothetical protein